MTMTNDGLKGWGFGDSGDFWAAEFGAVGALVVLEARSRGIAMRPRPCSGRFRNATATQQRVMARESILVLLYYREVPR